MARTPLMRSLRGLAFEHELARRLGKSVDAIRDLRAENKASGDIHRTLGGISRRDFILVGAAGLAAGLVPGRVGRAAAGGTAPSIAIIGGGLAGLTAALTLKDRGYAATIYEALESIGGRTRSDQPFKQDMGLQPACGSCHTVNLPVDSTWEGNQVTDVFGELIDTGHTTMRALAQRFGLPLIDLLASEPAGSTETYYFFGGYYSKADADRDYAALYGIIQADIRAAGYPTTYDRSKAGGRALDSMSIYDWIESRVPGGHRSAFGQLLDVAYTIEFGAETTEQSALNLLYLLGYSLSKTEFSVYGESDERYRIANGIEELPKAIAQEIFGTSPLMLGWKLERIAQRRGGGYDLTFGTGFPDFRTTRTETADIVILALPFAALRTLDYSAAGFDALKDRSIREVGSGHNGKLHLQFARRRWNDTGPWGKSGGSSYSDTGYQTTWEATRGQPGPMGILVNYTGGATTDALYLHHPYGNTTDKNSGVTQDAKRFLQQVEPVFPGISAVWTGRAAGAVPHLNPLWNCSYPYYKVGQYQAFAGYEAVPQGRVFFAGDHTTVDFQGWMEGAARSGVRAANEVLAVVR